MPTKKLKSFILKSPHTFPYKSSFWTWFKKEQELVPSQFIKPFDKDIRNYEVTYRGWKLSLKKINNRWVIKKAIEV